MVARASVRVAVLLIAVCLQAVPAAAETVLVEAEAFANTGGWVNDSQFMDQMGSPFLLAHGLGVPVDDATTEVAFPAAGAYRVWVRTRDWVAPWNAPGAPGRFQVLVDGKPLETTFGTAGAEWHWQPGGVVQIGQVGRRARIALNDLTGFEGRCDAIVFSSDPAFAPPEDIGELTAWRRGMDGVGGEKRGGAEPQPTAEKKCDLVVVGGGIAGTCAALSAARLGLEVALVQDRPVLGGNNSSEVRVWLQGARNVDPLPRVGDIVAELEQARRAHYGPANTADLYEDDRKIALAQAEPTLRLMLEFRVNAVERDGPRIAAIVAQHTTTGERVRIAGRWFADCTGDGNLGFLAGADFDLTPQGHMGPCNLWNVIDTGKPAAFPRCPWALDLSDKPFPGRQRAVGGVGPDRRGIEALGGWYWESGFDRDPIAEGEAVRDWNFRAMYGAWDALKNVDGAYPTYKLNWSAYVCGRRESRRLLGDVVLTRDDVLQGKVYPDGCVPTGWPIDLHLPDPRYEKGFEGNAFISHALYDHFKGTYWIPYRCLYSRNVPNLFMAGRDISVTHEALGTARVMRTGGCMGEVVGMAAAVCLRHDAQPRDVYESYFDELKQLLLRGTGRPRLARELRPPEWLASAGENLARTAAVSVSGSRDGETNPPSLLTDGQADLLDNAGRWLSAAESPSWVEFHWDRPVTVRAARIISGYRQADGDVDSPLAEFRLERFDGQAWQPVAGAAAGENEAVDWHALFAPVTADRLRLVILATPIDVARVWEVELYGK